MTFQPTTETSLPKTKRTREEALVWARGLVSQGIRVVRLRNAKLRRERIAAVARRTESFER